MLLLPDKYFQFSSKWKYNSFPAPPKCTNKTHSNTIYFLLPIYGFCLKNWLNHHNRWLCKTFQSICHQKKLSVNGKLLIQNNFLYSALHYLNQIPQPINIRVQHLKGLFTNLFSIIQLSYFDSIGCSAADFGRRGLKTRQKSRILFPRIEKSKAYSRTERLLDSSWGLEGPLNI